MTESTERSLVSAPQPENLPALSGKKKGPSGEITPLLPPSQAIVPSPGERIIGFARNIVDKLKSPRPRGKSEHLPHKKPERPYQPAVTPRTGREVVAKEPPYLKKKNKDYRKASRLVPRFEQEEQGDSGTRVGQKGIPHAHPPEKVLPLRMLKKLPEGKTGSHEYGQPVAANLLVLAPYLTLPLSDGTPITNEAITARAALLYQVLVGGLQEPILPIEVRPLLEAAQDANFLPDDDQGYSYKRKLMQASSSWAKLTRLHDKWCDKGPFHGASNSYRELFDCVDEGRKRNEINRKADPHEDPPADWINNYWRDVIFVMNDLKDLFSPGTGDDDSRVYPSLMYDLVPEKLRAEPGILAVRQAIRFTLARLHTQVITKEEADRVFMGLVNAEGHPGATGMDLLRLLIRQLPASSIYWGERAPRPPAKVPIKRLSSYDAPLLQAILGKDKVLSLEIYPDANLYFYLLSIPRNDLMRRILEERYKNLLNILGYKDIPYAYFGRLDPGRLVSAFSNEPLDACIGSFQESAGYQAAFSTYGLPLLWYARGQEQGYNALPSSETELLGWIANQENAAQFAAGSITIPKWEPVNWQEYLEPQRIIINFNDLISVTSEDTRSFIDNVFKSSDGESRESVVTKLCNPTDPQDPYTTDRALRSKAIYNLSRLVNSKFSAATLDREPSFISVVVEAFVRRGMLKKTFSGDLRRPQNATKYVSVEALAKVLGIGDDKKQNFYETLFDYMTSPSFRNTEGMYIKQDDLEQILTTHPEAMPAGNRSMLLLPGYFGTPRAVYTVLENSDRIGSFPVVSIENRAWDLVTSRLRDGQRLYNETQTALGKGKVGFMVRPLIADITLGIMRGSADADITDRVPVNMRDTYALIADRQGRPIVTIKGKTCIDLLSCIDRLDQLTDDNWSEVQRVLTDAIKVVKEYEEAVRQILAGQDNSAQPFNQPQSRLPDADQSRLLK